MTAMRVGWVRHGLVFSCWLGCLAFSGCIGAPGIPGGPLQGTGITVAGSYGYAVAPARVGLQSTRTGQRSSFGDPAGDAVNFPVFPTRLGSRVGVTDWFDAAGDISWFDGGLELRAGLPEGTQPFPCALSFGMRRGDWGFLAPENRPSSEQRVRLEAYPRLRDMPRGRVNLIATGGVSFGRRYHPFAAPGRFQYVADNESEGYPGPPSYDLALLRDETRIEASLGAEIRQSNFFASLIAMPYMVASASALSGSCGSCDHWVPVSYASSFGAAFYLTFGVAFNKRASRPVTQQH